MQRFKQRRFNVLFIRVISYFSSTFVYTGSSKCCYHRNVEWENRHTPIMLGTDMDIDSV